MGVSWAPVDPVNWQDCSCWHPVRLLPTAQLWHPDPLQVPVSPKGTDPDAKSWSPGREPGSGCELTPATLSTGHCWPRGSHSGICGKGIWKARILILRLSSTGGVDWGELAFLELSRRFSCCVSLLTPSQTDGTAPALPATFTGSWPVCPVVGLHPLPTAMFLQKELGCSPLVGIDGDLSVWVWSDAERTLKGQKCCFLSNLYFFCLSGNELLWWMLRGFLQSEGRKAWEILYCKIRMTFMHCQSCLFC